jgi:uncharacterized protein (DUF1330 family)
MSKGYWIATYIEISDPDKLAAYAALALPAITAAGGAFLARGMPDTVHESGEITRTVIIEFESVDAAKAAYESAAYREALATLGDGALRDIRLIAGT